MIDAIVATLIIIALVGLPYLGLLALTRRVEKLEEFVRQHRTHCDKVRYQDGD